MSNFLLPLLSLPTPSLSHQHHPSISLLQTCPNQPSTARRTTASMVGTTPLANHFARRELRPQSMHGMEDPAQDAAAAATTAAAATPTASTPSPSTKARTAGASKQRRAHGGEEGTENMLSRLTSKLQEKRKTFAFGFAVEDGRGGEQSAGDGRPLDDLVRELELGDSAKSELERKKKEKKKAKKLVKKGAAKPQTKEKDGGGECVVVEEYKGADADPPASSTSAAAPAPPSSSAEPSQGMRFSFISFPFTPAW